MEEAPRSKNDRLNWWKITLHCANPIANELSQEIIQPHLAAGIEIHSDFELSVYLEGESEVEVLKLLLCPLPRDVSISSATILPLKNWVAESSALHTPLKIGKITVIPVVNEHVKRTPLSDEVFVIPGMGFGTGHHATTASIISILQDDLVIELNPTKVFDLGTGSGILAIVVARLFACTVEATDIDEAALQNANLNLGLNKVEDRVRLSTTPIQEITGTYDLIVANIYAEVLADLWPEITSKCRKGGLLAVSGISADRLPMVTACFSPKLPPSQKGMLDGIEDKCEEWVLLKQEHSGGNFGIPGASYHGEGRGAAVKNPTWVTLLLRRL